MMKRDGLLEKHSDAKQLSVSIEQRRQQVSVFLRNCMTSCEYNNYELFIERRTRLALQLQEISDILSVTVSQLAAINTM